MKSKTKPKRKKHFRTGSLMMKTKSQINLKFNVFFTNVGPTLADKIKYHGSKSFKDVMTNKYTSHFTFNMIDRETVIKTINDMKPKSCCGFDGQTMKLLKVTKEVFIKPLLIIINQTLNTGIF